MNLIKAIEAIDSAINSFRLKPTLIQLSSITELIANEKQYQNESNAFNASIIWLKKV